jgi:hypothetical protein
MRIDVYHHFTDLAGVSAQLDRIESVVTGLQTQGTKIMADLSALQAELDNLKAEVARNTAVDESAVAAITGLAALVEANKTDPVALQAIVDDLRGTGTELKDSSDTLAAAVVANTLPPPA